MNHEQNVLDPWFDGNRTEGVPSHFPGFIDSVQTDKAALIFKYQGCQFE
jgi:hypothetical protein